MAYKRRTIKYTGIDYIFFVILAIIVIFGLVILTSASSDLGKIKRGDSFYYLKHQITSGLIPGIFGFIIGLLLHYKTWKKMSIFLLIITIILLLLTFTPLGLKFYGARRWIEIGGISFQPAELVKLSIIIYIASWLSKNNRYGKNSHMRTIAFIVILLAAVVPILLQPSTSTAVIIIFSSLAMYLTSGMDLKSLAFVFLLIALGLGIAIFLTPYRLERIISFSNPTQDVLGKNYQLNQSLMAIGNGGFLGVGYGKSTTKLFYLPEPIGDSIFAVLAEELGFVGSSLLIILFILLIWRGIQISKNIEDDFGRNFIIGSISTIGIQAFIHISAVSGLIPYTGVPLPFISYGGTSLAVMLTMCGIILNISKYQKIA